MANFKKGKEKKKAGAKGGKSRPTLKKGQRKKGAAATRGKKKAPR
jgi:hypothetical protein